MPLHILVISIDNMFECDALEISKRSDLVSEGWGRGHWTRHRIKMFEIHGS